MPKAKWWFVNILVFLFLIGESLVFLFSRPVETTWIEKDNEPGYTAGDELIEMVYQGQWQSIIQYPHYYAGFAAVLLISSSGFVISVMQFEKARRNEKDY